MPCVRRGLRTVVLVITASVCLGLAARRVQAQTTIHGTLTYTGSLGPISDARKLCLCVYLDPNLQISIGCLFFSQNSVPYEIPTASTKDYFLIAFVDLDRNEAAGAAEPYEIYRDRNAAPADAVRGSAESVDITFGDENLPTTATPSLTATETRVLTATPTPTPEAAPCLGDCDGSGDVTIEEITTMVNIALGSEALDVCLAADGDGSAAVEIDEIVAAVINANAACPASAVSRVTARHWS
jgi:hypothetical protein